MLVPDHFGWECANVLIGVTDQFSSAGARAFESAAEAKGIDVCAKAEFDPGSPNMKVTIKKIISAACCRATVVFAQSADLVSLLLEAKEQQYDGEWIVGDSVVGSLLDIIDDLKNRLSSESEVHELLRGLCCMSEFTWKVVRVASDIVDT